MAGTPIGKLNCYINNATNSGNQEFFKNVYDFFEQMVSAGWATRIALQYGEDSGPVPGTGTDYWDGANPFRNNAFFLYRMNGATSGNTDSDRDGTTLSDFDYYVLVQWADTVAFGSAPGFAGNPGLIDNGTGDGVAIAVAVREDGASPWNGSTNNDGTDTKGATVWTGGVSTVHVFPTANELDLGSTVTNKEGMARLGDISTITPRYLTMVGDADAFILGWGTGSDLALSYFGVYYPVNDMVPDIPLVCLARDTSTVWPITEDGWGTYDCSSASEGGILGMFMSDGMGWPGIGLQVYGCLQSIIQPNTEPATPEFDMNPVAVAMCRTPAGPHCGYLGDLNINIVQSTLGVATGTTDTAQSIAYLGSATISDYKLVLSWDGATTPGSGTARAGVTF